MVVDLINEILKLCKYNKWYRVSFSYKKNKCGEDCIDTLVISKCKENKK